MSDEKIAVALGLPTLASLMEEDKNKEFNNVLGYDEDSEYESVYEEENEDEYEDEENSDLEEIKGYIEETKTDIVDYGETDISHPEKTPYIESTEEEIDREYLKDVSAAKRNINSLIGDSHLAFNELLLVATQTGNPAAFDAASKMLKTIVDANEKMVGMSEKKRSVKKNESNLINNNNTTNNYTVILTTTEILKQLKNNT